MIPFSPTKSVPTPPSWRLYFFSISAARRGRLTPAVS